MIDIELKSIELDNFDEFRVLEGLYNNPIYKKQFNWCPTEIDEGMHKSAEMISKQFQKQTSFQRYYIMNIEEVIGEFFWTKADTQIFKKFPGTVFAHIGLYKDLGTKQKAAYKAALELAEEILKTEKLKNMEISVFEFNYQGLTMFKELGFREVGRIPKWTYYNGRQWGDIRLQKPIR